MTKREREETITTLLEWYKDAVETMNRSGDMAYGGRPGSVCLLMGDLWWHRSYKELDRVLREFQSAEPNLWWHVRERYITNTERTVLMCPVCDAISEVASRHFNYNEEKGTRTVKLKHKHGGQSVFFVLKTVPVLSKAIRPEDVAAGISWIAEHFTGKLVMPDLRLDRSTAAA